MLNQFVILMATSGKRPDLLKRTLESLAICTKPPGYAEAIVVENGQRGETQNVVHQFERALTARYLYHPTASKSAALNAAIGGLQPSLVFFTDDDVRFHPQTLKAYAAAAESYGSGRFFGGPCGVDYEQVPPEWLKKYLPASARGWHMVDQHERVTTPAFLGFNWAAFSPDLARAGGFNESVGPGGDTLVTVGDETAMQRRLLELGIHGIYVPTSWVWHYIPAERCAPAWIVDRVYRHGLSYGLRAPGGRITCFGWPDWLLMRILTGAARRTIAPLVRNPAFRFDAEAKQSYNKGLIRGFRLRQSCSDAAQ